MLLKDRIALITGASRGIGAAVAKRFAAEGAQVILAARKMADLEKVDDEIKARGGSATLVPIDLADLPRIDQLAAHIGQRFGRLDILVGNAAILGDLGPLAHVQPDQWQHILDINLSANWRLIRAFDKLLRQSEAGRAIFVTSGVTQAAFPYWGPYAISKAGLEMLAKTYAAEVAKTSIRVNLLDPGVVRTQMRAAAMPGENPMTLPHPDEITDLFVAMAAADYARQGKREKVNA